MKIEEMVEQFQCPGCVAGSDVSCGSYLFDDEGLKCSGHVLGTMLGLGNSIALGLPKGFCKPGWGDERCRNTISIRLYLKENTPTWDHLNVPVWALEESGFLFVRTFAPRINATWVDVIEDGNFGMVPQAINVADFIDEID